MTSSDAKYASVKSRRRLSIAHSHLLMQNKFGILVRSGWLWTRTVVPRFAVQHRRLTPRFASETSIVSTASYWILTAAGSLASAAPNLAIHVLTRTTTVKRNPGPRKKSQTATRRQRLRRRLRLRTTLPVVPIVSKTF